MLTAEHRAIITATVPLLEIGGEALACHFYNLLLNDHPQLSSFFNLTHLSDGNQPRALARSVIMYAKNINQLEQLGDLVNRVVNKHVALQIQPEHYPLVGASLLKAMAQVLGEEVATAEVLQAWGAAYDQLAGILIAAESEAYDLTAASVGGWRGARSFRLVRRIRESEEIVSLYFEPVDGGPVLAAKPGQYVALSARIDGQLLRRTYSLSASGPYRISVKREPGGKMSNYLHDQMPIGAVIELFAPSGEFTLHAGHKPVVLISAGVGITPTLPILEAALAANRTVHFIHCARNAQVHAFREHIDALAATHPNLTHHYCYSQTHTVGQARRLGLAQLEQWLPIDRDFDAYFLGPLGFMVAVKAYLRELGVPVDQTHYEFFGSASLLE